MYRKWYILRFEAVAEQMPEIPVRFYRTTAGREPALDWLRELDKADRQVIGVNLMRVQFGWPIGMPLVRSLGDGLWEVRSDLRRGRVARLLFCFHQGLLVVLHGFIKKTQKTPPGDLELARRRMREIAG
jgi:phage-related protein